MIKERYTLLDQYQAEGTSETVQKKQSVKLYSGIAKSKYPHIQR